MSQDPHAEVRAGGSADPGEPGPGSGVAAAGSALTGSLQTAANDLIDGLELFANTAFDVGETGLQDALKVVDAAQTGISNALSAITAKVTGGEVGVLPIIPTGGIAGSLTGEAQKAANRLLNGAQEFANHAFDVSEHGLEEALKVVDEAQTRVSALLSKVANLAQGRLGPPKG
jgi:hypothetical protein